MTATDYVTLIRRVQFEHFEGRISMFQRDRQLDRIWDRAELDGCVDQVNRMLAAQLLEPTPAAKGRA